MTVDAPFLAQGVFSTEIKCELTSEAEINANPGTLGVLKLNSWPKLLLLLVLAVEEWIGDDEAWEQWLWNIRMSLAETDEMKRWTWRHAQLCRIPQMNFLCKTRDSLGFIWIIPFNIS